MLRKLTCTMVKPGLNSGCSSASCWTSLFSCNNISLKARKNWDFKLKILQCALFHFIHDTYLEIVFPESNTPEFESAFMVMDVAHSLNHKMLETRLVAAITDMYTKIAATSTTRTVSQRETTKNHQVHVPV